MPFFHVRSSYICQCRPRPARACVWWGINQFSTGYQLTGSVISCGAFYPFARSVLHPNSSRITFAQRVAGRDDEGRLRDALGVGRVQRWRFPLISCLPVYRGMQIEDWTDPMRRKLSCFSLMESYLSVREAAFVLPETAARETYLEAGALSLRAAVVIWIFSWRLW